MNKETKNKIAKNENLKVDVEVDLSNRAYEQCPTEYPLYALLKKFHIKKGYNTVIPSSAEKIIWWDDIKDEMGKRIENTLQLSRTTFEVKPDSDVAYYSAHKMREHLKEIERSLWFGLFSEKPKRTRGLLEFYKLYGYDTDITIRKGFDKQGWYVFLKNGFDYGSTTKFLFVDNDSFEHLKTILKDDPGLKEVSSTDLFGKNYGIEEIYLEHVSAFGLYYVIKHPMFKDMMALIEVDHVKYRYLEGEDTKFFIKGEKGMLETVWGLQYTNGAVHKIVKLK